MKRFKWECYSYIHTCIIVYGKIENRIQIEENKNKYNKRCKCIAYPVRFLGMLLFSVYKWFIRFFFIKYHNGNIYWKRKRCANENILKLKYIYCIYSNVDVWDVCVVNIIKVKKKNNLWDDSKRAISLIGYCCLNWIKLRGYIRKSININTFP